MIAACLLGVGLVVASPSGAPDAPPDLAAYEAARDRAGRDPQAHVKLALWCEAHGLRAESAKHLVLAVLNDPRNAIARGLMGLVAHGGRWQRPEAFAADLRADESRAAALAEYNARRDAMPDTADAHWKLALWCEKKGLKPEATAHLTAVTRLDPGRSDAWKRLGCVPHQGRWMRPEEIDAEEAEAKAQKDADRHWKLVLTAARTALSDPETRDAAIDELKVAGDPRAVRAIWALYARSNEEHKLIALEMLRRIDGPAASHALAYLATRGGPSKVRPLALKTLRDRDPRDFVDFLIGLMVPPIKYQIRSSGGPNDPGVMFIDNPSVNIRRLYNPPFRPSFVDYSQFTPNIWDVQNDAVKGLDWQNWDGRNSIQLAKLRMAANLANATAAAAVRATTLANRQLQMDIQAAEVLNRDIDRNNKDVAALLTYTTGADLGSDREKWMEWWVDKKGYSYERPRETTKPTVTVDVPISIPPPPPPRGHSACFAAGTPVRTLDGDRPIESIKVGDQVLSQDTTRGVLGFRPVVAVHHNPPSPTLKLALEGGPPIVATGIHRFWKAGRGWTMARDLKPGDAVRTLGGTARLLGVESDEVRPVFNLEVAQDRDFFVGGPGALVHDFTLVQPVETPFDAAPELAAIAAAGR